MSLIRTAFHESDLPTLDEIRELTISNWGARSGLRLQLRTVLQQSSTVVTQPTDPERTHYFRAKRKPEDEVQFLRRRFFGLVSAAQVAINDGNTDRALQLTRQARYTVNELSRFYCHTSYLLWKRGERMSTHAGP